MGGRNEERKKGWTVRAKASMSLWPELGGGRRDRLVSRVVALVWRPRRRSLTRRARDIPVPEVDLCFVGGDASHY